MSDHSPHAADAAQSPVVVQAEPTEPWQIVKKWAVDNRVVFVSRSHGQQSTDTISLDALCDLVRAALSSTPVAPSVLLTDERIAMIGKRALDKCFGFDAQCIYIAREVERHFLGASASPTGLSAPAPDGASASIPGAKARAWNSVCDALTSVDPGWIQGEDTAEQLAVAWIKTHASTEAVRKSAPVAPANDLSGENLAAIIERLQRFADPEQSTQAEWDALDWRALCNRISRMLAALSAAAPVAPVVPVEPAAPEVRAVLEKFVAWNAEYPSDRIFSRTEIQRITAELDAINAEAVAALAALVELPRQDSDNAKGGE